MAKQAYAKIKVSLAYEYNFNIAYFDGIQLFKEEFGHSYVYDDDGNVVSVTDLQQSKTDYEYEDNNLTKMVLSSGATYEYDYDDYHNVTEAKSATGVTNTFEYNDRGLNTSVSIIDSKNTSNTVKITASAEYTENDNFIASQTDTMGNKTVYSYNETTGMSTGLTESVTVGSSTPTNYTYDEKTIGRLTGVSKNVSGLSGGLSAASVSYEYDDDYLTKITHSNTSTTSTTYNFDYGNFGLLNSVKVGNQSLISHTYNGADKGFSLAKSTYGNGHTVTYAYDDELRTESITYNDGTVVKYDYDNNGNLGTLTEINKDNKITRSEKYLYDATDRLMKVESDALTVGWGYDDLNNLTSQKYQVDEGYFTYNIRGDVEIVTSYTYDKDNRPTKITSKASDSNTADDAELVTAEYDYDAYGRNNSTEYLYGENTSVLTRTIGYVNPTAETTTNVISTLRNLTNLYDKTYTYTYDDQGNITSISDGTDTTTYTYDELNQLTRENNQAAGKTWTYTYNAGGNITAKREYAYTTGTLGTATDVVNYGYTNTQWRDLLTSWNGKTITSDAIGNMKYDGTWTYTWQNGRQLAGMSKSGTSISYTYDSDGMRTSKTVNGVTTKYLYYGNQLIGMDTELGTIYFHYDATGVVAMELGGAVLYYVKNAQGDITALVDTNGYPVVEYSYDAWGNLLGISGLYATIYGIYNPFTYRGYVYDHETGLYYLQSRYYSPEMGRFMNADDTSVLNVAPTGITDKNLFTYCDNSPVVRKDSQGTAWETVLDVISLCSSVADVVANPADPWAWAGLVGDIVDVAVPFVGGVGEITRGIKTAVNAGEALDTAGDIARAGKKAPIVIGENMKRVNQYAKEIGGHAYRPWKNDPFDYDTAMRRNKRWINDMMNEGREIIDIGPDFYRRRTGVAPSDFYNMERSQVKGYGNYRKVFTRQGKYGGIYGEW